MPCAAKCVSDIGEIACVILSKIYDISVLVDLVCDTYTPSVKDVEHTGRGEVEETYITVV